MQRRLLANAALLAVLAEATKLNKAYRSNRWAKPPEIEAEPYGKTSQATDDGHTCSFAQDRAKQSIEIDLN